MASDADVAGTEPEKSSKRALWRQQATLRVVAAELRRRGGVPEGTEIFVRPLFESGGVARYRGNVVCKSEGHAIVGLQEQRIEGSYFVRARANDGEIISVDPPLD